MQTRPYDFGTDAIERQRVSLGQAMMDADFEYGLQATKWQSYVDIRKFPSFFEIPGTDFSVSNVVSDGAGPVSNITVTYTTSGTYANAGTFISMFGLSPQSTLYADRAEGYFLVSSNTLTTANYLAKGYIPSGNIQSNFTFSRKANVYNGGTCVIPFTSIWSDGFSNLQVYTSNAHGLLPGTPLLAKQSTTLGNAGYSNFFGSFFVSGVTSSNSFNIAANTYIFGSSTLLQSANLTSANTTLYIGQYASQQHRPYDGGVLLSTLSPAHGSTVARQSKKAFRYQSGKGILFSSGTLFSPNLDIQSATPSGLTTTTSGVPFFTSPIVLQVNSTSNLASGQTLAGPIISGTSGLGPISNTMGILTITSVNPITSTITANFLGTYPQTLVPSATQSITANATTQTTGTVLLTGAVNLPTGTNPQLAGIAPGQVITGLSTTLGTVTAANVASGNVQVTFTGSWPLGDVSIGSSFAGQASTTAQGTSFTASTTIFSGIPGGQITLAVNQSYISNGFTSGQLITVGGLTLLGQCRSNTSSSGSQLNLDSNILATGNNLPFSVPAGTVLSNTALSSTTSSLQVVNLTLSLPITNLTPTANGFIAGQTLSLGPLSNFINNLGTVTCSNVGYGYIQANFTGTSNLITSNIPSGTWINLASNPTTGLQSQTWINGTTINLNYTTVSGGLFAPGMNLIFSNLTGILTPLNANVLVINPATQNLICYASGSGNISSINQTIIGTLPQGNVLTGTFTPPAVSINATTLANVLTVAVSNTANYYPGQTLLGFSSNLGNCIVSSVSYTPALLGLTFTNASPIANTIPFGQNITIVPPVSNTFVGAPSSTSPMTIPVQSTLGFAPNMGISFSNPSLPGFTSTVITAVTSNSITFTFTGAGGTIPALTTVTGLTNVITTTSTTYVPAYNNIYVPLNTPTGFTANMFAQGLGTSFGSPVISNVLSAGVVVGFSNSAQLPVSLATNSVITGLAQATTTSYFNLAASSNLAINSNTGFLIAGSNATISGFPTSFGKVTLSSNATPSNPSYLPLQFGSTAVLPYTVSGGTSIVSTSASVSTSGAPIETPSNNFSLVVASTAGFLPGQTINTYDAAGTTLKPFGAMSNVTINAVSASLLTCNFQGTYSNVSLGNTVTFRSSGLSLTSNILPGGTTFTIPVTSATGFAQGQTVTSYLGLNMGTVTITGATQASGPAGANLSMNFTGSFPTGNAIPIGTTVATLPAGSNLQLVTDQAHGIPTTGAQVTIRNFTTSAINGTGYTVTAALDSRTINVSTQQALTSGVLNLGDQPRLVVTNWHGSTVRAGTFEDPNGLFWEYDGQTLSVVRRQSTFTCAGYCTVSPNQQILIGTTPTTNSFVSVTTTVVAFTTGIGETSNTFNMYGSGTLHNITSGQYCQLPGLGYAWVVGQTDFYQVTLGFLPTTSQVAISGAQIKAAAFYTPTTRFQDQLKVNDRFTLRGMIHQVTSIQGQGILTFNPPFRGAVAASKDAPIKACKIKELRVPQAQFNRDTIDGKGPSGYKVDLSRQQMIGLQYTWYGAGFVDFMIRGPDGNWVMCHRIKNNNVNDEAYMRSGNLPVRYELSVESRAAVSSLVSDITASQTTITINDPTTYFPPSGGTLLIDNELVYYTGVTTNSFTGCTRAAPLTYVITDTSRTFTGQAASTHLAGTSVNLISCTATPTMTHWGSSFLTDGGFDSERGYYFNYSNTAVTMGPIVTSGQNPLTIPIQASAAGFSAPGATAITGLNLSSVTPLSSLGGSTTSFTGIGNVVFTATTGSAGTYAFGLSQPTGTPGANCVVVFNSTGPGQATYTAIPGPYPGTGLANIISVGNGYTSSTLSNFTNVHVLGGITISGPGPLGSATFGGTSGFTQAQSTGSVTNPGTMFKITGSSTTQANCFIPLAAAAAGTTVLSSSNAFITYPGGGFTQTDLNGPPIIAQIVPTISSYSFPVSTGSLTNPPSLSITQPVAPGPYIVSVTSSGGTGGNVYFIVGTNGTTVSSPFILTGGTGFGASTPLTAGLTFVAVPSLVPTITNARFSNATVSSVASGSSIIINFVGTFPALAAGSVITNNTTGVTAVVSTSIAQTTTSPVQIFINPSTSSFAVGDSVTFSGGQGSGTVTAVNTTNPSVTVISTASQISAGTIITDTTSGLSVLSGASVSVSLASSAVSAFAIRLAPSVTNGLSGDIGQKELLNRAQLLLQKLEATSPVNMQTIGFLNPTNVYLNPANWININTSTNGTQPSFAQYYPGNLITGVPQPGERIFQTIVQANNQNNLDLTGLKELTNSTIGGNQPFPDGPDVLLIYCTNLTTTTATAQINLFWSEAQA